MNIIIWCSILFLSFLTYSIFSVCNAYRKLLIEKFITQSYENSLKIHDYIISCISDIAEVKVRNRIIRDKAAETKSISIEDINIIVDDVENELYIMIPTSFTSSYLFTIISKKQVRYHITQSVDDLISTYYVRVTKK